MPHRPADVSAPARADWTALDEADGAAPELRVEGHRTPSGWPLRVKLLRALWWPWQLLFLSGTGRLLSPLRVAALALFGARIRGPVLVMDGVKVWHPWSLAMQPHSTLGRGVEVYNFADVTIGEQATVSQYAYLCTASHDHTLPSMPLTYRPITIAAQAWITAGCFIGPGVSIGQGAVCAARSVVVRDVAPWAIVAGNPARVVGRRRLRRPAD